MYKSEIGPKLRLLPVLQLCESVLIHRQGLVLVNLAVVLTSGSAQVELALPGHLGLELRSLFHHLGLELPVCVPSHWARTPVSVPSQGGNYFR